MNWLKQWQCVVSWERVGSNLKIEIDIANLILVNIQGHKKGQDMYDISLKLIAKASNSILLHCSDPS